LAAPIIIGQLGQISVNIVDNVMVGDLGAVPLAAVSLAVAIFVIPLVVGMGLSMALQPLVAECDGAGDAQGASFRFKHSLGINLIFAVFSILAIEATIPFLGQMGQEKEVVELAIPYLRICAWSMIPMMAFQSFRGLAEGLGATIPATTAILCGNVVNIIVNYLFIYGKMGAPALGVEGAALGTMSGRVVMFIMLVLLFRFGKQSERLWSYLTRIQPYTYSLRLFRTVLRLGVPSSLQMLFEVGAFAAAAIMMGMISAEVQAAHQIAINVASVTFMVCIGFSAAGTIEVGRGFGKKDMTAMRSAGFSAIHLAFVFMCLSAISFLLLRHIIPTWYIDDESVIEVAATLFLITAVFQISDGIQATVIGALRGIQDVWWPTGITFVAYLGIGLPFCWFSAFHWDMGYVGIWIGLTIGLTLSAALNTWRFHRLTES
jgi:MATE family multidrug resistance protein